ncbi:MAG: hypothetical protein DSY47_02235 [Hydrogenothermus sp.]|nr:MAG: hypothetical protein DSY47_02235 [Hydrogenothermus sp.]
MEVIKIEKQHLELIAKLHKENFSDEHTTFYLGEDLLKKYYKQFLNRQDIFFLGIEKNGRIVGIILGGDKDILAFCRKQFLENYKNLLMKDIIRSVLITPYFAYKLFYERIFLKFFYKEKIFDKINLENSYNILSIVVDKKERGKGLGKLLVDEFEKVCKENNKEYLTLSVRKSNKNAISFYKKVGFIPYKETNLGLYLYKKVI